MKVDEEQRDGMFGALGEKMNRSRLIKLAGAATATIAGIGVTAKDAFADGPCGDDYGRCNGCLCCGSYTGCPGGPATPEFCTASIGSWTQCCVSGGNWWTYTWTDYCYTYISGGGDCSGRASGCGQSCTSGSCTSYCGTGYCCTVRTIAQGC